MATDAPQTLENEIPQHAAAGLATGGTDQPAPRESIARSSKQSGGFEAWVKREHPQCWPKDYIGVLFANGAYSIPELQAMWVAWQGATSAEVDRLRNHLSQKSTQISQLQETIKKFQRSSVETNVSPLRCAAIVAVPHERRITLRFETDFQYAAAERYVCFTERGAPALRCPPCLAEPLLDPNRPKCVCGMYAPDPSLPCGCCGRIGPEKASGDAYRKQVNALALECAQSTRRSAEAIQRDSRGHAIGHPMDCRINNGMDMNCDCGAENGKGSQK